MTTATETVPAVGTQVRITQAYVGGGGNSGQVGTLTVNDNDCCAGQHRFTVRLDDGTEVWASEVEPVEPRPLRVGDRVRLTRNIGGTGGVRGMTGVLEDRNGSLAFRSDSDTAGGAYGGGLYSLNGYGVVEAVELVEPAAEPTVASGDLADAIARAEKAERDLDRFRTLVRDRVIEEAADQGWCDRTDEWLEELGLEPREPESNDYTAYVDVNLTLRVAVGVSGPDEDSAAEWIDTDMVGAAIESGAYSLHEASVVGWDVDYLDAD